MICVLDVLDVVVLGVVSVGVQMYVLLVCVDLVQLCMYVWIMMACGWLVWRLHDVHVVGVSDG